VKSPSYVAVHHLISGMGDKTLIELIRKNETAEFFTSLEKISYFLSQAEKERSPKHYAHAVYELSGRA
jgi:hypothetical protein